MTWLKTAFADMTDDQFRRRSPALRRDGNRLYEVTDEQAYQRAIELDCEINAITYALWKKNVDGFKRIGVDASAYEKAGPMLFGLHDWEHPRRTRMVKVTPT